MTSATAAGGTILSVESTVGFDVGDTILIEGGGSTETGTIASIRVNRASSASARTGSIVLAHGTTYSHPAGSTVTLYVTTTLAGDSATAMDDPHLHNLAKEDFTVNQPGSYTLLRVPQDPGTAALLSLEAFIAAGRESQCGMYIVAMRAQGAWLGGQAVHVRPLRRDKTGSNAAGTRTLWPFSLQVSAAGETPREEEWLSFDALSASDARGELARQEVHADLPGQFRILAHRQERLGNLKESEAFQFRFGAGREQATATVMQASHQALNVELAGMGRLGEARLGGLLGTEQHDRALEVPTEQCRMSKGRQDRFQELVGVRPASDWARHGLEDTIGTASW